MWLELHNGDNDTTGTHLTGDTLKIYNTALNNSSDLMASIDLKSVADALTTCSYDEYGNPNLTFNKVSGKYKANS